MSSISHSRSILERRKRTLTREQKVALLETVKDIEIGMARMRKHGANQPRTIKEYGNP